MDNKLLEALEHINDSEYLKCYVSAMDGDITPLQAAQLIAHYAIKDAEKKPAVFLKAR